MAGPRFRAAWDAMPPMIQEELTTMRGDLGTLMAQRNENEMVKQVSLLLFGRRVLSIPSFSIFVRFFHVRLIIGHWPPLCNPKPMSRPFLISIANASDYLLFFFRTCRS